MTSIEEVEYPDASTGDDVDDAALEAMKARVAEMEAEAAKLREMQEQANNGMGSSDAGASNAMAGLTEEEKEEVDARSVYVGNVSSIRL
jgi:polyadenylate-binding protein 2